jgi:hypothetical protein
MVETTYLEVTIFSDTAFGNERIVVHLFLKWTAQAFHKFPWQQAIGLAKSDCDIGHSFLEGGSILLDGDQAKTFYLLWTNKQMRHLYEFFKIKQEILKKKFFPVPALFSHPLPSVFTFLS